MNLSIIILAAGRGKRMESSTPKVMHKIGGVPMLERVVRTAQELNPNKIYVVHGNGSDILTKNFSHLPVKWVKQKQQLGTGHAVLQAIPYCKNSEKVIVLYADVPLISAETLKKLLSETPKNSVGIVVTALEDPAGFGRIIRNEMGNVTAIVEHKDANEKERAIKEINTGILTAPAKELKKWLPKLKNKNAQGEYYLTDLIGLVANAGFPVGGVLAQCHEEVKGVNDRWQLAELERYFQYETARALTLKGVTIVDPKRFEARAASLEIAQDVELDINVILEGKIKIGFNTRIGSHVVLKNVEIGKNVTVLPNTIIENATIQNDAKIGPFARIRPGTFISENAHVGNFVEVKNTKLGVGSKANHLTYLGDATIGKKVNIGAGTITCNYDGKKKYRTTIEDGAFIGSNTALVAPVKIGKKAMVGAGSTITQNVSAKKLALGRARQVEISRKN